MTSISIGSPSAPHAAIRDRPPGTSYHYPGLDAVASLDGQREFSPERSAGKQHCNDRTRPSHVDGGSAGGCGPVRSNEVNHFNNEQQEGRNSRQNDLLHFGAPPRRLVRGTANYEINDSPDGARLAA